MLPLPGIMPIMRISTADDYRHALERINQLRGIGKMAETHAEMADLQAAIAAYEAQLERSDTNKGKPRSDPQRQFDIKRKS